MTKEELVVLQKEFIRHYPVKDNIMVDIAIHSFTDFLIESLGIQDEFTEEKELKKLPVILEKFFTEYFLYNHFLSEDEKQDVKKVVVDFYNQKKGKFNSLSMAELQEEVNNYWDEHPGKREVYMALSAFVSKWKLEHFVSPISSLTSFNDCSSCNYEEVNHDIN